MTSFRLIFLLLMVTITTPTWSHEVRPGYLELTDETAGQFAVLWKIPARGNAILALEAVLPESCQQMSPKFIEDLPGARLQRWQVDCSPEGLNGKTVTIAGLQTTLVDVLVRVALQEGTTYSYLLKPESPSITIGNETEGSIPVSGYLTLGIEHILLGIDHLLFVLALLLIVRGVWLLVKTVTSFTIAHSITLGLATVGVLNVPIAPVEAAIALSIVFVGAEIIRARRGQSSLTLRHPWVAAFGFGLLHGLGFASALSQVGLPANEIPLALLLFNVGVEIGQLMFIAAVLVVLAVVRQLKIRWPMWIQPVPAYAIGSIAAFWFIGRVVAFF